MQVPSTCMEPVTELPIVVGNLNMQKSDPLLHIWCPQCARSSEDGGWQGDTYMLAEAPCPQKSFLAMSSAQCQTRSRTDYPIPFVFSLLPFLGCADARCCHVPTTDNSSLSAAEQPLAHPHIAKSPSQPAICRDRWRSTGDVCCGLSEACPAWICLAFGAGHGDSRPPP